MDRRPCWVEISTGAFEENYRVLVEACAEDAGASVAHSSAPVELLAIVKADAYGHGLAACAPAAVRAGARWLGGTSVEEGLAARAMCPAARILVMGGIFAGQGPTVVELDLAAVVWELDQLDELETAARAAGARPGSVAVHLEIDTGMSRQGRAPGSLAPLPS